MNMSGTASESLQLTKSSNRLEHGSNEKYQPERADAESKERKLSQNERFETGTGSIEIGKINVQTAALPPNVQVLEQITMAERLHLKSDFARGRSRSNERVQTML